MPFQDLTMLNFCFAVRGSRGSRAGGGGGSGRSFSFSLRGAPAPPPLDSALDSLHPMATDALKDLLLGNFHEQSLAVIRMVEGAAPAAGSPWRL